ncbi:hypothetical protein [Roseiflexus castenholzii]|uniref:hypothetical protein n=1 Tax=Roseiflexus castenholzii TaxID=120962 RepID=UPI003C7CC32C
MNRSYGINAVLRSEEILQSGRIVSLDELVNHEPPEVRAEVLDFLQFHYALGEFLPNEEADLTPDEAASADRIMTLARRILWES